jgi:prepilin peptidase CpaA
VALIPAGLPGPAALAAIGCLALLALLLLIAAIGDVRARIIPNRLCLAVALLAFPFWLLAAPHPLARIATQCGLLLIASPVLLLLFERGAMGGGDIKLIAALMLWLMPAQIPQAFVVMALAGAAVAITVVLSHRIAARSAEAAPPSVPYGVAIALAMLGALHADLATLLSV